MGNRFKLYLLDHMIFRFLPLKTTLLFLDLNDPQSGLGLDALLDKEKILRF